MGGHFSLVCLLKQVLDIDLKLYCCVACMTLSFFFTHPSIPASFLLKVLGDSNMADVELARKQLLIALGEFGEK